MRLPGSHWSSSARLFHIPTDADMTISGSFPIFRYIPVFPPNSCRASTRKGNKALNRHDISGRRNASPARTDILSPRTVPILDIKKIRSLQLAYQARLLVTAHILAKFLLPTHRYPFPEHALERRGTSFPLPGTGMPSDKAGTARRHRRRPVLSIGAEPKRVRESTPSVVPSEAMKSRSGKLPLKLRAEIIGKTYRSKRTCSGDSRSISTEPAHPNK